MMQVVCRRSGQHPKEDEQAYAPEGERKETVTGEMVCVRRKVDLDALRADLQASALIVQWWRAVEPLQHATTGTEHAPCTSQMPTVPCKWAALPDSVKPAGHEASAHSMQ
jgi:hypothetical protein